MQQTEPGKATISLVLTDIKLDAAKSEKKAASKGRVTTFWLAPELNYLCVAGTLSWMSEGSTRHGFAFRMTFRR